MMNFMPLSVAADLQIPNFSIGFQTYVTMYRVVIVIQYQTTQLPFTLLLEMEEIKKV